MIAAGLLVTVLVVRPFDRAADRTGGGRDGVNPGLRPPPACTIPERAHDGYRQPECHRASGARDQARPGFRGRLRRTCIRLRRASRTSNQTKRGNWRRGRSRLPRKRSRSIRMSPKPTARGDLLWTHSHKFAHERAVNEFRKPSASTRTRIRPTGAWRVCSSMSASSRKHSNTERALAINPSNAQALNSRAQALLWSGKDEEALAILQSIPGPVLPELVEANTVFAFLRLNMREQAWAKLRAALGKYPADPNGALRGMEAMLVADSDPSKARALIQSLRQRRAANPSHHAAYFAGCALARMRSAAEAVQWLREAAATGFPCYSLFARDPNLDPSVRTLAFRRSRRRWRKVVHGTPPDVVSGGEVR